MIRDKEKVKVGESSGKVKANKRGKPTITMFEGPYKDKTFKIHPQSNIDEEGYLEGGNYKNTTRGLKLIDPTPKYKSKREVKKLLRKGS